MTQTECEATTRKKKEQPASQRAAPDLASDAARLRGGEITGSSLAALRDDFVLNALSLGQRLHSGTLDGGNVDEYVLRAVFGLDESKTLRRVEKFNSSNSHTLASM